MVSGRTGGNRLSPRCLVMVPAWPTEEPVPRPVSVRLLLLWFSAEVLVVDDAEGEEAEVVVVVVAVSAVAVVTEER